MGLTPAQQNAVDCRNRTLLVSAAAGAGKTHTLTLRVIDSILHDEQDISKLLIVTFTKAAASQLKERVAKAISDKIVEILNTPDYKDKEKALAHLQNQIIKLGSANISTIDSFFMQPVRENFEKLGLPASIRMADDAEILPLREKLMHDVLDKHFDRYEKYKNGELSSVGESDTYIQLIGIISETRDSSKLIPTLFDIYSKLLTSSEGINKLLEHADRFKKSADMPFFETEEGKILREHLCFVTDYAHKTMEKLYGEMSTDPALDCEDPEQQKKNNNAIACIQDDVSVFFKLTQKVKTADFDDVVDAFAKPPYKQFRISDYTPCDIIDRAKEIRDNIKTKIIGKAKKEYLFAKQDKISRDFRLYSDITLLLYEILSEFDKNYREEKLARGIFEFSDMPLFMFELLKDKEYADQLANRFSAVYIDEYQDVNKLQDDIFTIIGRDHRFMVGDIKQSIYGFRDAEPSIFRNYKRDYKEYEKGSDPPDEDSGNTIFMSENMRCDRSVIDFTNTVCSTVFTTFAKSIEYTPQDNLRYAKDLIKPIPPDYKGYKVMLNIVQTPDKTEDGEETDNNDSSDNQDAKTGSNDAENSNNLSDEAIVVANEIANLIRSTENDKKPILPGDIKILLRSHKHEKPILSALSDLNIKYVLSSKKELFETAEMKLIIALLEAVDNPHFDMPLCHLMTGRAQDFEPWFSFEEVLTVRRAASKTDSLYDAVVSYAASQKSELAAKCDKFTKILKNLRTKATKLSADKVIKSLSFNDAFRPLSHSAAYTFLYDNVCKYVKSNWNSLHSFLEYFKKLIESDNTGGEPAKSTGDAVTVMTIHQSKGLETRVCFLFGFGKQFNTGSKYNLVYDKDLGPTLKLPPEFADDCSKIDRISKRHEETVISNTLDCYLRNKSLEEEARMLYVAMTRAEERLYISATLPKLFEEFYKSLEECVSVDYEVREAKRYIDWILLSLSHSTPRDDLYDVNVFDKGKNRLVSPLSKEEHTRITANILKRSEPSAKEETGELTEQEKQEIERQKRIKELRKQREILFSELYQLPCEDDAQQTALSMIPSKIAASKAKPTMLNNSVFISIPESQHQASTDEQAGESGFESDLEIRNRIDTMLSGKTDLNNILLTEEKPTAAEKGTAAHQFLQFCDYGRVAAHGVEGEIQYLRDNKFIGSRTTEILKNDVSKLQAFFDSSFFAEVCGAKTVRREFHFRMFRPASDFTTDIDIKSKVTDKVILVQGSIDLVLETNDGKLILCDYKTDKITPEQKSNREKLINDMKERHGSQLEQYKYACKQIFGKEPEKIVLFLLSIGEAIEV